MRGKTEDANGGYSEQASRYSGFSNAYIASRFITGKNLVPEEMKCQAIMNKVTQEKENIMNIKPVSKLGVFIFLVRPRTLWVS